MAQKARILLIDFPTQYKACATLLRFQERYESPKFRNRPFTLEQFMDWYASVKGNFSYTYDWAGFNIPSHVLEAFRNGEHDPLSRKEAALLELLRDVPRPFYLIGTYGGDTSVLAHETVHGLYYGHADYAKAVRAVVRAACRDPKIKAARKEFDRTLTEMGYTKEVFVDELNAYATTGWTRRLPPKIARALRPLRVQLQQLFKERFGVDLSRAKNHAKLLPLVTKLQYSEFEKRLR